MYRAVSRALKDHEASKQAPPAPVGPPDPTKTGGEPSEEEPPPPSEEPPDEPPEESHPWFRKRGHK
jgi:hypothetical protein